MDSDTPYVTIFSSSGSGYAVEHCEEREKIWRPGRRGVGKGANVGTYPNN